MLRNAVAGGRVSDFPEKSFTNVYGSKLLALRGVGVWVGVKIPAKKRYLTFEWPPSSTENNSGVLREPLQQNTTHVTHRAVSMATTSTSGARDALPRRQESRRCLPRCHLPPCH